MERVLATTAPGPTIAPSGLFSAANRRAELEHETRAPVCDGVEPALDLFGVREVELSPELDERDARIVRLQELELVGSHGASNEAARRFGPWRAGNPLGCRLTMTDRIDRRGASRIQRSDARAQFAHPVEREIARLFDEHGVAWLYEPHTLILERDSRGADAGLLPPGLRRVRRVHRHAAGPGEPEAEKGAESARQAGRHRRDPGPRRHRQIRAALAGRAARPRARLTSTADVCVAFGLGTRGVP
jgi:hypothetical protein